MKGFAIALAAHAAVVIALIAVPANAQCAVIALALVAGILYMAIV